MNTLSFKILLPITLISLSAGCGDGGSSDPTGTGGGGASGTGSSASSGGGSSSGSGGAGGANSADSRCIPADYDGPAVYVSLQGDDQNMGTKESPVRTFAHALEIRKADEAVLVYGGTYTEKLLLAASGTESAPLRVLPVSGEKVVLDATGKAAGKPIDITGSHVLVQGFEVTGSGNQCVDASGTDIVLCRLDVHDCQSHGIQISGQRVWAEGNAIRGASLENEGGSLGQSGWGSGLKVRVGGEDITLYRNRLYHNWGEGMAVTRGHNVVVRENLAYDNFSVNFYIDNSYDVLVEKNLATCTPGSGFERDGKRSNAFQIGEEYYDGWGAQLHAVTIRNNISAFCNRGFLFAGSDVGGGLVDVSIVNNTFWGSVDTSLSIAYQSVTKGTIIHNNIVDQPEGKTVWIEDLSGLTVSHQLWVQGQPADWTNGAAPGDRTGDPGFYGSPGYDAASYRLGETSGARDGGLLLPSVEDDFEGRLRSAPSSEGVDMGAMEFGDPSLPCAFDALWK